MKKLLTAMMVLCTAGQAMGLMTLGPPRAGLKQKQRSLEFLFASSEMDLEMSGYGLTSTMPDAESTAYLVKAAYGISDGCELYSLLGLADLSNEGYDGDADVAWGFGTKFTFAEAGSVAWGGVFQMLSMSSEGSMYGDIPGYGFQTIAIETQIFDIQIAVGPTYTGEGFSLYGGPFLHFVDGDLEGKALGATVEFDLEQKSEFGGYIGATVDLAEFTSLFVEYQMTGDASAIAGGIVWRF